MYLYIATSVHLKISWIHIWLYLSKQSETEKKLLSASFTIKECLLYCACYACRRRRKNYSLEALPIIVPWTKSLITFFCVCKCFWKFWTYLNKVKLKIDHFSLSSQKLKLFCLIRILLSVAAIILFSVRLLILISFIAWFHLSKVQVHLNINHYIL